MIKNKLLNILQNDNLINIGYVDTKTPNSIAYADNNKYANIAKKNKNIRYLIITKELKDIFFDCGIGLIVDSNPRDQFYQLHTYYINKNFYKLPFEPSIGSNYIKCKSAIVHSGCFIGDNVQIEENVIIKTPSYIGSNVRICSGSKVGFDGILYQKDEKKIQLIEHAGYVRIGNDVTIMANANIVRSIHSDQPTEIGSGSLIGMDTIIGHDVKVGKKVLMSNKSFVARRTTIGNDTVVGTGVIIKENLNIGNSVKLVAGSFVINDVADGDIVSGNFATNHSTRLLEFFRKK